MKTDIITVIAGLPRSGTSLMMQIVNTAGIEVFSDNLRVPDKSNPKGYAEHEKVKGLMKDNSFLKDAENKAIKIVSPLIPFLDLNLNYQVIIMQRELDEILDSQQVMLGKEKGTTPPALKKAFEKIYANAISFLELNNINYIVIPHRDLLSKNKESFEKISEFINTTTSTEELVGCVDEKLYRQRK